MTYCAANGQLFDRPKCKKPRIIWTGHPPPLQQLAAIERQRGLPLPRHTETIRSNGLPFEKAMHKLNNRDQVLLYLHKLAGKGHDHAEAERHRDRDEAAKLARRYHGTPQSDAVRLH
jgi:hypothetical protein